LPQLIKPQEVKVLTRQGECEVSIVLELNINLNADGLNVVAQAKQAIPEKKEVVKEEKENDFEWAIPDFGTSPKIKFGKQE
jgi:hypothetical protein